VAYGNHSKSKFFKTISLILKIINKINIQKWLVMALKYPTDFILKREYHPKIYHQEITQNSTNPFFGSPKKSHNESPNLYLQYISSLFLLDIKPISR